MITADQILAHLVGDYLLQSDWMATEKTKRSIAALAHAACYSLPFLFFRPSIAALTFVAGTHFVIDRWRLARYVVWAKNFIAPVSGCCCDGTTVCFVCSWHGAAMNREQWTFTECAATGYPPNRPPWLATWLLIIADNTLHLICNGIALRWL